MNIDVCTDLKKGLVVMTIDDWNQVLAELEKHSQVIQRYKSKPNTDFNLTNPTYLQVKS
jgi:hypothetical protein